MNAKNQEALTYGPGPEWVLPKFANLPTSRAGVDTFINERGELYPGWDSSAAPLYIHYAKEFRRAWHAKTRADKEAVSRLITKIFEREITAEKLGLIPAGPFDDADDPQYRPAVVADFESGTTTVKPRTLLDWLAKSLLDYRDKLAICQRENCENPYFIKMHARQRFCSLHCANQVRKQKKEQWWAENRDRFLKKWRQERKAGRQKKRRKSFERDAPLRKQRTRP